MSLAGLAKETLVIIKRGDYVAPSGKTVEIRTAVDAAVQGTKLYAPAALEELRAPHAATSALPRVEVTDETTGQAGRRLVQTEGVADVLALNFASAKNPGGGFLGGAKAQEEDLARCSALYTCQLRQPFYYEANRKCGSMLYTDHVIYSPKVPFFRNEKLELLEEPFALSVITAPAPNAGESSRQGRRDGDKVNDTLTARAGKVLAVAAANGHRCLLLGAWGCGVFRNDPRVVADAFAGWLSSDAYRGAFDRVVFAVYDRGADRPNYSVFRARFLH